MAHKTDEAWRGGNLSQASNGVCSAADTFDISRSPLAVYRIARRLRCSDAVAALVAELAGLGPRNVR